MNTLEQKNKAIAEFMELETEKPPYLTYARTTYLINGYWYPVRKLKYHLSFDWLMEVVMKIETIENGRFGFTVDPWGIAIIDYASGNENEVVNIHRENKPSLLDDYFEAVTEFLEWHKTNKLQ